MTSTERATKPLPPVEQVRPGLWSIPVPLPIPLRYVLVYRDGKLANEVWQINPPKN